MIDVSRIEEIRALPVREAKAAMKAYAKELGVAVKAKTIDNMVSEMEAQLAAKLEPVSIQEEPIQTPDVPVQKPISVPPVARVVTQAVDPRAKSLAALPAAIGPIAGREFAIYAKPTMIDNVDRCTFQWKKDGADIAGATGQRYVVVSAKASDAGSYTCTIRESDGTETESSASVVGALVDVPAGFPLHTLFKPTWIEFYGSAFAPIGAFALAEAKELLKACDDNAAFVTALHTSKKAFQIYSLMNSAERLVLTDARDGYPNEITSATDKNNPIKEIGRWK